jgi:hypothetical protein
VKIHFKGKRNPGDILKVRVMLKTKHVERWHEIKDNIRMWGIKHGYLIHSIEPIVEYQPETFDRTQPTRKTDAQYINEYAARRDLDEVMTKAGLAYLN